MSNDPLQSPPDPQSDEPTVLDLFKSVTKDWPAFSRFVRSLFDSNQRAEIEHVMAEEALVPVRPEPASRSEEPRPRFRAWRSSAGIVLALLAQFLLEPPKPNAELGLAFYVFALG